MTWNEECDEYQGNLVVKCAVAVCVGVCVSSKITNISLGLSVMRSIF